MTTFALFGRKFRNRLALTIRRWTLPAPPATLATLMREYRLARDRHDTRAMHEACEGMKAERLSQMRTARFQIRGVHQ